MEWYYASGNERKGPVTQEALVDLVAANEVTDSTLVWHEGMPEWQPFARHRVAVAPGLPPVVPEGAPMYCMNCGRPAAANEMVPIGGRRVCASCKPIVLQQMREGGITAGSQHRYAGFWIRFAAVIIDTIVVGVASGIFGAVAGAVFAVSPESGAFIVIQLMGALGAIVYEIAMIAAYGATVGKMALGLKVIRAQGGEIGAGLSVGRYFSKFISALILLIGYMMAGWDPEKRALHDRICDTRVIKTR